MIEDKIFIAHSKLDIEIKNFFKDAFILARWTPIFEELEQLTIGIITPYQIMFHIEESAAVFVILTQNVQEIEYTRDWVVWETGVSAGKNKDIWIFEYYPQLGNISIVVPYLTHYVLFDINDYWKDYIRKIIESYDRSGTKIRPQGIKINCANCFSVYNVHLPKEINQFRCPSCNRKMEYTYL